MHALSPGFSASLRIITKCIPFSEMPDHDLVVAAQNHEHGAFTVLYGRYVKHVTATIFRLSPDWRSAHDDMIQEVFVRVWKSLDSLENPWAFRSWLNRLIKNMFYDELRRRPKIPLISLDQPFKYDEDDDGHFRDIADTRHLPDDNFARKELAEQINAAMVALPWQFAKVVAMREVDGLSYEEIAALTHTSLGTVKSRICRGRLRMQSQLQPLIAY